MQAPDPIEVPISSEMYERFLTAKVRRAIDPDALLAWFKSEPQKRLRIACVVYKPNFDRLSAIVHARCEELRARARRLISDRDEYDEIKPGRFTQLKDCNVRPARKRKAPRSR